MTRLCVNFYRNPKVPPFGPTGMNFYGFQHQHTWINKISDNCGTQVSNDEQLIFYTVYNEKLVLHCDTGPAIIKPNRIWFFYNGINYSIEDMPVDDEIKCIWALKYPLLTGYEEMYVTYSHN